MSDDPTPQPRGRPPKGKKWADGQWTVTDAPEEEAALAVAQPTRPRGRPPAGKKWSDEEGAYVDDPDAPPKVVPTRPRGRPPAGKVWSEEASAYVDMPFSVDASQAIALIPLQPAPKKDKPPKRAKSSASAKPRGRPPRGKVWSEEEGAYVSDGTEPQPAPKKAKTAGGRPRGRPPTGKIWSQEAAAYV